MRENIKYNNEQTTKVVKLWIKKVKTIWWIDFEYLKDIWYNAFLCIIYEWNIFCSLSQLNVVLLAIMAVFVYEQDSVDVQQATGVWDVK